MIIENSSSNATTVMELLTIRHADFTITIECGKFDAILTKAKNNIGGGGDRSLSPFDFILNPPISNVSKKQDTDLSLVPLGSLAHPKPLFM